MMKLEATNKAIKASAWKLLSVGYCEMQHLLQYESPFAYTHGVYGWNYDAYDVDGITICTGYRGMPQNIGMADNWRIVNEYEKKAEKVIYSAVRYEEKRETVSALLRELLGILQG